MQACVCRKGTRACMHVHACVCVQDRVCVYGVTSEGFILETFSFKLQLPTCKGPGGKYSVSRCTAP